MKQISSYSHGVLDYIVGIVLLLAPNIFKFSHIGGPAVSIPRFIGFLILAQALLTNYELGVIKAIPFRVHLMADYLIGIFLAISPWLFGFNTANFNAWLPHALVGVFVFGVTLLTNPEVRRISVPSGRSV